MKTKIINVLITGYVVAAIWAGYQTGRVVQARSAPEINKEIGIDMTKWDDIEIHGNTIIEPYTFDDLLDAIEWVESRGDANAAGDWTEWKEVTNGFIPNKKSNAIAVKMGNDNKIYYRESLAIGAYQISKIYVDDLNRVCEQQGWTHRWSYSDRWDKDKSRQMVYDYIGWYLPKPISEGYRPFLAIAARIHNGGPNGYKKEITKAYWQKVKARMKGGK